jgi:hypothetical protein
MYEICREALLKKTSRSMAFAPFCPPGREAGSKEARSSEIYLYLMPYRFVHRCERSEAIPARVRSLLRAYQ